MNDFLMQISYVAIRLSSYLTDNQEITDNQTYFSVGGRRIASISDFKI